MVLKPATPGFLVTLTATILLVVVSFNVPYFKSVYFLQASYGSGSNSGSIILGTMGYCVTVSGNQTCTKPSIGYEFNPNQLLGDSIAFAQIPTVVTKWLTYALFLHVIALACAGISAIFGLLAHIREFSMTCFSSCISGLAASVTLIAFIFDLVLFFLARTRIREVKGSTAVIGNAIWLTLAAWVLLFISGCMYTIGRCCLSSRPRAPRAGKTIDGPAAVAAPEVSNSYAEQMRLEAIKAEIDRKSRQQASDARREGQLPAFEEYEIETRPLTHPDSENDHLPSSPYRDQPSPAAGHNRFGAAGAATGYTPSTNNQYAPQRQPSLSPSMYSTNNAGGGAYGRNQTFNTVGYPPMPQGPSYGGQYGQGRGASYGGEQSAYAGPGRQPSLSERNIYENAGLGAAAGVAAGVAANDYLRPGQPHGRADSYGQHSQASSYQSAYSHQPYYSHTQDPSAIYGAQNQSYTTPYDQPQQHPVSADDWHPGMPNTYAQHPQSPQTYNASNPYAVSGVASSSTVSDAYNKPLPTPSPGSSSPYGPTPPSADLNFPGVPARPPVDISAAGAWRSPSSPQRLHGWREESEPSTMGRTGGNVLEQGPSHEAPPPEYEPSDRSGPAARNDKLTFRQ